MERETRANPAETLAETLKNNAGPVTEPAQTEREPEPPAIQTEEAEPAGRPEIPGDEEGMVARMVQGIQEWGLPRSQAALLVGLGAQELARLCQKEPQVALDLGRAEAEFQRGCLAGIRKAAEREEKADWRAHVWLLEHSLEQSAKQAAAAAAPAPVALSAEQLENLKQRRAAALQAGEGQPK